MSRVTHRPEMHRSTGAVYLESNSPPALVGTDELVDFDTYYDHNGDTTTNAALDDLGLSTSDDKTYTVTRAGIIALVAQVTIAASPGHSGNVILVTPDYPISENIVVTHPNTLGNQTMRRIFYVNDGDTFTLYLSGTNGDSLLTYATIAVMRLIG